jgi:hypothetical protein
MPIAHFPPYPRLPQPNGGQARISFNGTQIYFGKHRSPESVAKYDELRDEWTRRRSLSRATLTIDQLALSFLDYAKTYYLTGEVNRRNGTTTAMVYT